MKRGSSADGLAVGHLARKARDAGSSPAQHYTFRLCEKFTPEKIIYLINISELRNACLDDCRQSSICVCALSQK